MTMFTIRMIGADGTVLHERVTDDPIWYLSNMINWAAVQPGERIEIVVPSSDDAPAQAQAI